MADASAAPVRDLCAPVSCSFTNRSHLQFQAAAAATAAAPAPQAADALSEMNYALVKV